MSLVLVLALLGLGLCYECEQETNRGDFSGGRSSAGMAVFFFSAAIIAAFFAWPK